MNWIVLEDKFRLYCPDHFYWYNQRVHGIGKLLDQKGKLSNKNYNAFENQLCLLKTISLAPGPALPPGLVSYSMAFSSNSSSYSYSYSLLPQALCSSLDDSGRCPDQLGLVPLTLGVEQLPLVVGDVGALLDTHCERLLVGF